jgi:hypothetical protein
MRRVIGVKILTPMKTSRAIIIAVGILAPLQFAMFASTASAAGCPYTPAASSAERKAILNALRKPIARELGQAVRFRIETLSVCRGWAFVEATPQKPNGKPIDWSLSSYEDAVANDACGLLVHGLLAKNKGQWKVRQTVVCATDVPYVTWSKEFGAPVQIFPYQE